MLIRNVNYEVPALRKHVSKCVKAQQECLKKESEYRSLAVELRNKYAVTCKNLGIEVRCCTELLCYLSYSGQLVLKLLSFTGS